MSPERREKSFEELKPGDTIGVPLLGWKIVGLVPEVVAQAWICECFPRAVITNRGLNASEAPIKEWPVGLAVVVGVITTIPGEEQLSMLARVGVDKYHLLLSSETRKKQPQS